MKKTKALLAVMAALVTMICFVGCGGGDDPTTSIDNNTNPSSQITPSNNGNQGNDSETKSAKDYIEVKIDDKTYKREANGAKYVQYDPIGYDDDGTPVTFTFNSEVLFENYGFSFQYGIVHFSDKSKLLASKLSNYKVATYDDYDNFYNNLVFNPVYEEGDISFDTVKNATHTVTSLKEVNGDVQIQGKFSCTLANNGKEKKISGSYQMTVPF